MAIPPERAPGAALPELRSEDSLSTAIAVWEQALQAAGNARNTVEAFCTDLRLLMHFLGGGRALADISTQDLQEFLDWMETEREVPCSPKTYSRRVTSVKAFFRFAAESGVLAADPAAAIIQRVVQSPLPEILTRGETERVLSAARGMRRSPAPKQPDDRPFVLVSLLLQTGIKKGECIALRKNHIDLRSTDPCLFIRYSNPRQRFKERKLALSREWVEAYENYSKQYELSDRVFPWSPRRLEYLLEEIGVRARLVQHLSFDMCRWTCAVLDRKRGMEPDAVRQKLGLSRMQWREVGRKLEMLLPAAGEEKTPDMLYSLSAEDNG
jgi:site-specific recombinase XerD